MSQSRDARVWLLCQVITGLPLPPVYDAKVALKVEGCAVVQWSSHGHRTVRYER